jgi:hypothetical protein
MLEENVLDLLVLVYFHIGFKKKYANYSDIINQIKMHFLKKDFVGSILIPFLHIVAYTL